jgi:seryl-tRNA synthetase
MSFEAGSGLLTAWGESASLMRYLDDLFRSWAAAVGAVEYLFPPVISVRALDRAGFFASFPHFTTAVAPLRDVETAGRFVDRARRGPVDEVGRESLADARYLLAPAACYAIYDHFQGRQLEDDLRVTTLAPCFRREEAYEAASRQWAFWMREIVCIGRLGTVQSFLDGFRERLARTLQSAGFPFVVAAATDPFFDRSDPRLLMQRLGPVKDEIRYQGSLAIASVNFHRNFFGERFDIRDASGGPAFSGCVAFGLERWMTSLTREYGDDWKAYPPSLSIGPCRDFVM